MLLRLSTLMEVTVAKGDVHVSQRDAGGWEVKREGASRASSTHQTQAEAWNAGRKVAQGAKSEAYLHGRDGKIRERNTYGHDPTRSKG
jgi:hypothetical protein